VRDQAPRVSVLGIHVSTLGMQATLDVMASLVAGRQQGYVTLTGVHGVMESVRDPNLRAIHNEATVVCPDGVPLVWSARWAGFREAERVYGPNLMLAAMERSVAEGWRHFLYGAGPNVADLLAERLRSRYPGVEIVGTWTPPFRPLARGELEQVADRINSAAPDFVWIGLSTPKQERWMAEARPLLDAPVLAGVGAAFDIHAGLLSQAPPVLQRAGLEWAYRLWREPRRLWRRYLRNNPVFALRVLARPPVAIARSPVGSHCQPDPWISGHGSIGS
jgi:N-acetylglucosaminyldiphosphoundecaprenol N-acetyl-beta-D-mannosaminyltransferase